MQANIVKL